MRDLERLRNLRFTVFAALGLAGCSEGAGERTTSVNGDPNATSPVDMSGSGGNLSGSGGGVANQPLNGASGASNIVVPTTPLGHELECTEPQGTDPVVRPCIPGATHRVASPTCVDERTVRPADDTTVPPAGFLAECTYDSDCTEALSYCQVGIPLGAFCVVGCLTDDDCEGDLICMCAGRLGSCTGDVCRSDDECEPGAVCLSSEHPCGGVSFVCTADGDKCRTNADCPEGTYCETAEDGRYCAVDPSPCPVPGRPFVVGGAARVAAVAERADWRDARRVDVAALSAPQRETIGRHWLEMALMEHASVASFARFQLQLLALGAPAQLLLLAQRAQADEQRHALGCFALASEVLGHPVGPSVLRVEDALSGSAADRHWSAGRRSKTGRCSTESAERVLSELLSEGCVGETCAALEAECASVECGAGPIADWLQSIARDEQEHGLLAWRTLRWLLQKRPELRGAALVVYEKLRREVAGSGARADSALIDSSLIDRASDDATRRHGVLPVAERRALRLRALKHVVLPALDAFLSSLADASRPRAKLGRQERRDV